MRVLTTLMSMLLISLLSFPIMTFAAEQPIRLFMNGKQLAAEAPPQIVKGNTLVPVRIIAESLGSKVQWDEKSRKVTVVKSDVTIQLFVDKNEALVNNKKTQLEAPPQINNGNTMLPVRFVSEQLGVKVAWDELTRSVFLSQQDGSETTDKPSNDKAGNDNITTIKSITLDGDTLSLQTSGLKPEANIIAVSNANQVVIDIPHSKLDPALKLNAKGEGTVKETNEIVTQARYLLFSKESSIVRILIDSSKKLDLNPTTVKAASGMNVLAWKLTPQQNNKYKVVIDPGHGGKDTGAVSVTKRYEKDFVLSLGTKVYKLLEQEPRIEPHMTRSTDNFIELSGRTAFANDMKADLFVSIHGNSAGKESVSGTETYYYTDQSAGFASAMHDMLIDATGFQDRKVRQNDFYVIKHTTMPSLLLEVGFLSNGSNEEAMYREDFQNRVAASIVAGIKKQLNID